MSENKIERPDEKIVDDVIDSTRPQVEFRHCGVDQRSVDEGGKVYCHVCHDVLPLSKVGKHEVGSPKPKNVNETATKPVDYGKNKRN